MPRRKWSSTSLFIFYRVWTRLVFGGLGVRSSEIGKRGPMALILGLDASKAVVLALLAGMVLQGLLFICGIPCSGWPMSLSFLGMAVGLAVCDRMVLARFIALCCLLLALTAFTFSYTVADALSCHFPMQDLMRNGWNPLCASTPEALAPFERGLSLARSHILFMPKATALCGALVSSATGLFAGDAFIQYAFMAALAVEAYEFARRLLGLSVFPSFLFAFALTSTTKISGIMVGYVDCLVYAEVVVLLLSGALYRHDGNVGDLLLFACSLVLAATTKPNALAVAVIAFFLFASLLWKDCRFWKAIAFAGCVFLVIGASPYITSTINYASPLYPAHSFSARCLTMDLTADFLCNDDGAMMGRLSRFIYAWISPELAVKACAFSCGKPDFCPEFAVYGGVAGMGGAFRILFLVGIAALIFSKKNIVTLLCVFLMVTTVVTPLKYVGYARYFPWIWAMPFLALFNLAADACRSERFRFLAIVVRVAVFSVAAVVATFVFMRTLAYCGRCFAFESRRQAALEDMRRQSSRWRLDAESVHSFTLVRRLEVAGIDCCVGCQDKAIPRLFYDWRAFWLSRDDAEREGRALQAEFPIPRTLRELAAFPWRKAYGGIPHILWNVKSGKRPSPSCSASSRARCL